MISAKLIELIERRAESLALDVARDIVSNAQTPGFRRIAVSDLQQRLFELVHRLGDWIGDPDDLRVRAEFEDWGHRRFGQGIPLSQIIYAVILTKQHLRRYILDHGLVDAAFPRIEGDYVLPMHLQAVQQLNVRVADFFDKAIYFLAVGHETGSRAPAGARALSATPSPAP